MILPTKLVISILPIILLPVVQSTSSSVDGNHSIAKREIKKPRIVGGKNTNIESIPWQVSIRRQGSHWCGGSIINVKTILSAAHCYPDFYPVNTFIVWAGTNRRKSLGNGQKNNVVRILKHPEFISEIDYNDIALLTISKEFIFDTKVQPVKLPVQGEQVQAGEFAIISGWGTLKYKGNVPKYLQSAIIPIIDHEECVNIFKRILPIPEHMLCAGSLNGQVDSCSGDSGGPLTINGTLYGIVSWGIQCAVPGYPGVYTYVSEFRNWIDENV